MMEVMDMKIKKLHYDWSIRTCYSSRGLERCLRKHSPWRDKEDEASISEAYMGSVCLEEEIQQNSTIRKKLMNHPDIRGLGKRKFLLSNDGSGWTNQRSRGYFL